MNKSVDKDKNLASAAKVKKLRDETGVGMMDCKKVLDLKHWDYDEALKYLTQPEEVEVFCSLCNKPIGKETIYHNGINNIYGPIYSSYCEECQHVIDEEEKRRKKEYLKEKAEEKRLYKEKMAKHRKEMLELKKSNPVGYMSVFYAACRDCKVTSKCPNCQFKFCAVCDKDCKNKDFLFSM